MIAKAEYGSISIVGHSMGAALALLATKEIPVERIVLAAPALSCPELNHPQTTSCHFSLFT